MRTLLARTGLTLVGLGLGLIVIEAAVRVLDLDHPVLELALVRSSRPTSRHDPRLGWVNLPDSAGELQPPGRDRPLRMATNRQGFRFPRDYQRARGAQRRVAILGDSQVYGFFVGEEQHLGVLVDRARGDLEAYPFGVPGYGPTQELLLLEEVLADHDLDVVVAVAFLENDLNDATQRLAYGFLPKPYLHQDAGGWGLAGLPVPVPLPGSNGRHRYYLPRPGLFAASASYRLLALRASRRPALASAMAWVGLGALETVQEGPAATDFGFRRVDGREPACNIVSACPEEQWLDGLPPALAAYEQMQELCSAAGVRFLILISPAMPELDAARFPITDTLTDALQSRSIEFVSLAPVFATGDERPVHVGRDWHWTVEGTQVAASALLGALDSAP